MSTRTGLTIRVRDLGEYGERLRALRGRVSEIMRESLEDALTNGRSEVLADIWRRTPQSDRARYAFNYKAIDREDWKANGSGLRSGWRRKITEANGEKTLARLDEYGQQRLRKSVFGGQDTYGVKGLQVETTERVARFTISSDVPYARRMHEADQITDYWSGTTRGVGGKRAGGWSTLGTGSRFITGPVTDKAKEIREDVQEAVAFRLEEAMR